MQFSTIYRGIGSYARQMSGLLFAIFAINTLPMVYAGINWTVQQGFQVGALLSILNLYFQYLVVKQFLILSGKPELASRKFTPRIFGGQIIYTIAVLVGLICLVLPGIYVAVKFSLYVQFIVDQDLTISESFNNSWETTDGQFLNIFYLIVPIIVFLSAFFGLDFLPFLYDYPMTYLILSELLLSISIMFPWLVFSAIYIHLQKSMD